MLVIVFSATGHIDCAFVFAAYKMRSDATTAARSVVDIADKVMESRRRSGMTLLNRDVVVYQVVTRVTAVTVDASVLPRWFSGRFRKDFRRCMRESSQMVAIFADGDWCCNNAQDVALAVA
jgi:hypothetical protein